MKEAKKRGREHWSYLHYGPRCMGAWKLVGLGAGLRAGLIVCTPIWRTGGAPSFWMDRSHTGRRTKCHGMMETILQVRCSDKSRLILVSVRDNSPSPLLYQQRYIAQYVPPSDR